MTVYIAQGHGRRPDGTFDPGAREREHTEQRDSKPVADACTRVLRAAGIEVFSESDMADDPNFYGTTAAANEAGVKCVVSFHYDWNQAPPGAFAIWKTTESRQLGEAIEHRVQEAGFDIRDYTGNPRSLYLLNNTDMPAVIFECGRIGHEDIDEPDEQRAMGEAAALGILDWLGVSMAHTHQPPRSDLPRSWADGAWEKWVEASGTNPDTRTHDFYREDLSWVYTRVIQPLESKVAQLTQRVRQLEESGPTAHDHPEYVTDVEVHRNR